jgi:uncharacterized RDD family membrane protein YckC
VLKAELAGQLARCSRCGGKFVAQEDLAADAGAKWYYAVGDEKKGPLPENEFDRLVADGTIAADTLVWRKGMSGWQTLGEVQGEIILLTEREEMVQTPVARAESRTEKAQEATEARTSLDSARLVYAGGVKRLLAKVIDAVFMFAMATLVDGLGQRLFPAAQGDGGEIDNLYIITLLIDMLLGMLYLTGFLGKFGATPGKMVFNLKVVTSAGGKVGYGQAFGRYCAETVVIMLTLMLGYLPILFDAQKRGLHDRLCNTRVVKI